MHIPPTVTAASADLRARYEHLWRAMHYRHGHDPSLHYTACRWEVSLPDSGGYILTVHRDDGTSATVGVTREASAPSVCSIGAMHLALARAERLAVESLFARLAEEGRVRPATPLRDNDGADAWTQTFTGVAMHALAPTPEMIRPADLAHQLALTNRYRGATARPYSVAEHSLHTGDWIRMNSPTRDPVARAVEELAGFVHDAAEAYLGDPPGPYAGTEAFAGYRAAVARMDRVVEARFGLPPHAIELPIVKRADRVMLATEAERLFPANLRPRPWGLAEEPDAGFYGVGFSMSWEKAEKAWLSSVQRAVDRLARAREGASR